MEQEADGERVPGGAGDREEAPELTLEVVESIADVEPEAWDALLGEGDDASPFLEHRFLSSLEDGGALDERSGWIPRFPIIRRGERIVAAAPAYVKLHSQGEFVFDWSWAEAAERLGIAYYPKLLVGVPFTPVTGRRLLTAAGEDRPNLMALLGKLTIELCELINLSSVHVNFALEEEVRALESVGFLARDGIQYHWQRHGEPAFDDYLARFTSKRRNQIKRERRELADQNITIELLPGAALDEKLLDTAFELYKTTVEKFYWGRQYLNREVFGLWRDRLPDRLELMAARRGKKIVAGAINFAKGKRLYGRYWGAFEEVRHLHFNVCYYAGIDECFAKGFDAFEPGAGGEHKLARGFEPTLQRSAHWVKDPRFREILARHLPSERMEIRRHREAMLGSMGVRGSR